MFVLTTVTRDCKNGDLYVSVDDNAYLTKEAASTALRARYEDFLKSMKLEDNGASDENGNAMPGLQDVLHSDVLHWRSGSCRSRQLSVPGRRTRTDRFLVYA